MEEFPFTSHIYQSCWLRMVQNDIKHASKQYYVQICINIFLISSKPGIGCVQINKAMHPKDIKSEYAFLPL